MNDDFSLGKLVGKREAFSLVAGRCEAADVAVLREIKGNRLYLNYAKDWSEFCETHLHISRSSADRLIRYLDEFGPTYFEIAQLTRISPETYRLLVPFIHDGMLHYNGEAIAFLPENAEQVTAVVVEERKKANALAPPAPEDPIARLERRCTELLKELESAIDWSAHSRQIEAVVCSLRERLQRLEQTI
jgi:hypothetical protein